MRIETSTGFGAIDPRTPAVCRSELARDPQCERKAKAALVCKQAPTKGMDTAWQSPCGALPIPNPKSPIPALGVQP